MHKHKLAAIVLTLLTLSACGKSTNNDPAPGPQPFASPSPEPTPSPTPTSQPEDDRIPEVKSIERDLEAGALLVNFNIPIKPNGTVRLTINDAAVKHQLSWSEDKTQLRIVFDRKPYATTPFKLTLNLEGVNGNYANFVKTLSFVEDKDVPVLVSATQVGLERLVIVFSEPLSEKTQYFHFPTDISTGPVFSEDRTTLTLPFDRKKTNRFSKFEITSAVDMAGNGAPQPFVFRFDLEGPALEGIVWQDDDILQVKFNEPAILENSVVTIDGKTIENLGVDRSRPQQILNIPLKAYGIDKTESHRLTITQLFDVYGNIIEGLQAGFSQVQDKTPPMITAVEQEQSRTMGGDPYLNFLVRFSERVVQGSRVKVNGVTLSLDDNFSFADDHRSMKLSIRANRTRIDHNTANQLSMELVDAMENKGISLFEFKADSKAPSVSTKQSKQINAKTLRLAFNEADVKDIKVSFWNITGPAYTLSPLRAEEDHWVMDVTFDGDMPDVDMFLVKVTDTKGNVTEEGSEFVHLTLITESPRFSSVTYSEKNAISIAMHRAVGRSEPPELIDAEGKVVSSDDYTLQWTASKDVLNIFFKQDLKAPLGKINLRKVTRKENEKLLTELLEIDKLGFLPETYLSGSYQSLGGMKATLVVAATVDPGKIKVFRYDYEDNQSMLKPFDCQISSEAYQFQGFNRILITCPGTGLKTLKIELSNPDDAVYQDIW